MSSTMPAIVIQKFGGPDVLQVRDQPLPVAASGQALVKLAFVGVNFVDLYQRQGRYPGISLPLALGLEGAGEIVDVAPGASFSVGQRVAFTTGVQGAYASHVAVPLDHLVPVPPEVSLCDAAAALEHGLTAAMLLDDVARLRPGDAVLPHFLPDAAKLRSRAASVFEALRSGAVQLRVHAQLPIAEAAQAHELLVSRSTQGKLLLQP